MATSSNMDTSPTEGINELFQKIINNGKDPNRATVENILLLGLPGAGKSALLCSLNAALTGKYNPWMRQGSGIAQTNTLELRRFERCGIREFDVEGNKNKQVLRELLPRLPHFWDFAGLGNMNSDELREIIYLIIHGYIPPCTNYRSLELLQNRNRSRYEPDEDGSKKKYDKQHPEWKITTVVFVHSCRVEVPTQLINCLLSVLNDIDPVSGTSMYNGDVFVVITKQDLADKSFTDRNGVEDTPGSSTDGQVPREDTSSSETGVAEVEGQLAAMFNIQGSLAFSRSKLTNYSDDNGYDYNPEITKQHLHFLYLITLPKDRIGELGTSTKIRMQSKIWLRWAKRDIIPILNVQIVCLFITVIIAFIAIVWYIMA